MPNESIPSSKTPVVTDAGLVTNPWLRFFTRLLAQPGPIMSVPPTGSPLTFVAPERGSASVLGGAVSSITVTRARTTISAAEGSIPLAAGDTLVVTYTVAPTIDFVPG